MKNPPFPYSSRTLGVGISFLTTFSLIALGSDAHSATLSGFQGNLAPSNWTIEPSRGSSGSVNTSNAPNSITISSGSDSGSIDYTINFITGGTIDFDWNYIGSNASQLRFGYVLDDNFVQLTNNGSTPNQSGSITSLEIFAGQTFGFRATRSGRPQNQPSLTTISGFSFTPTLLPPISTPSPTPTPIPIPIIPISPISSTSPPAIPEPSLVFGLIGIGLMGVMSRSNKNKMSE